MVEGSCSVQFFRGINRRLRIGKEVTEERRVLGFLRRRIGSEEVIQPRRRASIWIESQKDRECYERKHATVGEYYTSSSSDNREEGLHVRKHIGVDLEVFGGIRHGYHLQKLCEILEMVGDSEKKREEEREGRKRLGLFWNYRTVGRFFLNEWALHNA